MHEEWTDKLSDFLDDELTAEERDAVAAHLQTCAACTAVLEDLKQVVARARGLENRPPQIDLWPGVAARIDVASDAAPAGAEVVAMRPRTPRRFSFTMPQLVAASLALATLSGGLAWSLRDRMAPPVARTADATPAATVPVAEPDAATDRVVPVALADAQYDAAVSDLERALKEGRGKLDQATITIVEHNLATIDEAIRQAREALAADPANAYLSGHLVEARRRKLDLLRRAAALTSESD